MSIKEFAELVGMSITALRHYDNEGIFRPAKHGEKFENKYRYYSPEQITAVKMSRVLTEIGVPLQTIKQLTQSRTPEKLMKLLRKQKEIVVDNIRCLQEIYSIIGMFMELLGLGISATETDLSVSEMDEQRIVLGDTNDFTDAVGFYREFARFCNAPHEFNLNCFYPVGGYFENMDAFLSEPSQPTRFFTLDPNGHERKLEGTYLTGYTRGYYGKTNRLPTRMAEYAEENGLVFTGPVYNIYLFDEISITDPEQYLLQVSAPVRETRRSSRNARRRF